MREASNAVRHCQNGAIRLEAPHHAFYTYSTYRAATAWIALLCSQIAFKVVTTSL